MAKIIVIGGGAAGMMAAIGAAAAGNKVILYERNEKLGKKLYITGKGRCNLTNDCDAEAFLQHVPRNPKFLYSAIYTLDSRSVMDFFEKEGLPLKTERGSRVFPQSDKSSDVIRTLANALQRRNVQVHLNTPVKSLCLQEGRCCGVRLSNQTQPEADAVIVATGGLSYPSTGSTGDGYRFAKTAGHTVIECFPSLVPLEVREDYVKRLQGLSLKNVTLTVGSLKKPLFQQRGELLFTHFGLSGPLVLSASSMLSGSTAPFPAQIDLKPALTPKQLDDRLLRDFKEAPNVCFKNSLGKLLPAKLIPEMVSLSGISPQKRVNEITKAEREGLLTLLKAFPFTITGMRDFKEAVITRGGVSVREVNPATMESKRVKGLYFAGELLDTDAYTGGYNLQIAWSTGFLAGSSAANAL